MLELEKFLTEFASALQVVKLYTLEHIMSKQAVDKVYERLLEILNRNEEIVIGIVGEEFVSGKEVFFELSKRMRYLISDLISKGIEKIILIRGVSREELYNFIKLLITKKEDIKVDYEKYLSFLGVKHIYVGRIKTSDNLGEERLGIKDLNLDEDVIGVVSNLFTEMLFNDTIDVIKTKVFINNLFRKLLNGEFSLFTISMVKEHDLLTFLHSINVAILSMFLSARLNFNKENIINIGIAGLFHDMGKIAISKELLSKPGSFNYGEMKKMHRHTIIGARILLKYVNSLGILPALVAFEHHLRYDLGGYPKLIYPYKPHKVSLIVSLCDFYDALRLRRSYKKEYPPEIVYNIMFKEKGRFLDPLLFDKFFSVMGVYPVGTVVELSNGFLAVVKEENEEDIFSPKVEVISLSDKSPILIDLKKRKDIRIKCSVKY
ncbi:MAG: HD domain-containing protein [Candidatus Omnitrophica bacterium]|nr:HD domain-containing protein [Candidatus Omnitrophota bacterium]